MRFTHPQKVLIIGASSGIGAALVREYSQQGDIVAAVARRADRLEQLGPNVLKFVHDVTDFAAAPQLFLEITHALGGLDVIIYAAGVMPTVSPTEFNFEKDRQMIDTNLLGAIAWLNLAAERFSGVKHGTIIAIGSVAGDRGRYGQPVYNTSKAALATYMESLRNRVCRHGVKVVTIKPGPVATEMTASLNLKGAMPVEVAAKKILVKGKRTGEHYLSVKHWLIFAIIRNFPSAIFRKLKV